MRSHRTTARGFLSPVLALVLLAFGVAAALSGPPPAKIVFPVLNGPVTYGHDFGDARGTGAHQGIDIMARKRSLALAAEAGRVEFWKSSANAGCMLYLHGASGTTYYYIHLNNDLTQQNDNRGKCAPGTAYAKGLKNGAKVAAGQPIGYVGDSGDANGIHAHLHFELHPAGQGAVDPYPWLRRASRLLFAAPRGTRFTLELLGSVASVSEDSIQIKLSGVKARPMGQRQARLNRRLTVSVPSTAVVQRVLRQGLAGFPTTLANAKTGQQLVLLTAPARATLKAQRGDALALSAASISLIAP